MTVFLDNTDLLSEFRAGNSKALCTVHRHYAQRVGSNIRRGLRLASGGSSGSNDAIIGDLLQDVFVRAFSESARQTYDGLREYGPFLAAIAHNILVDYLRRQGREEPLDTHRMAGHLELRTYAQEDDAPWADAQIMQLAECYVGSLPEREHAVYTQRYAEDRSQAQAAEVLGLSRQQVRTLEGRLRAGLAQRITRARLAASSPWSRRLTEE